MRDPIHIVICSDTHFALAKLRPFFFALRRAHAGEDLRLHYLLVNGSQDYQREIGGYCESIGLPMAFYEIGAQVEAAFAGGVSDEVRWTLAIYGRLLMAEVLSPDIKRAVYMDFDTICVGNLRELLAQTEGCQTVAAAVNLPDVYAPGKAEGLNAGVQVVPLGYWRKDKVLAQLLGVFEGYKQRGEPVPLYDQGLMNAVFVGRWMRMPLAWNAQAFVGGAGGLVPVSIWASEELAHPKLFHYAGTTKPWNTPTSWLAFPKPAALAYAKALAGVEGRFFRWMVVILTYRLLTTGRLELVQGSFRMRFMHRLAEVVFGRESPAVVLRWLGGALSRRMH